MILNHLVLCICTRNRPDYVQTFLDGLVGLAFIPKVCVVVDSSDNLTTKNLVEVFSSTSPIRCDYLYSLPGLPHQRNTGINYLQSLPVVDDDDIISFLDDDVAIRRDYFKQVSELFDENPNAICVGGYLEDHPKKGVASLFRRMMMLESKDSGKILKSGLTTPPIPSVRAMRTQWVQGGMQNYRMHVFRHQLFDGRVRMYGEDVEFQLRINKYGEFLCSNALPVRHLKASSEKEGVRSEQSFTDGFRWSLAQKQLVGVTRRAVISSTIIISILEALLFIICFDRTRLQRLLGHLDFLYKVIFRIDPQQYVSHEGSGPLPSNPIG